MGIPPCAEIDAAQPCDVGILPISLSQVLAVGIGGCNAVVAQCGKPAVRGAGVKEHQEAVLRGKRDDSIELLKIVLVRLAQVIVLVIMPAPDVSGEWPDSVHSGCVFAEGTIGTSTDSIDPASGIKSLLFSNGKIMGGLLQCQKRHH